MWRRDAVSGQDRCNQCDAVRRARDIAIGQARALIAAIRQQPRGIARVDVVADVVPGHSKRVYVFALENRNERIGELARWRVVDGRNASRSSVAFSSRPKRADPSTRAAKRWKSAAARSTIARSVAIAQRRNREVGTRDPFDRRRRQVDANQSATSARFVAEPLELGGIVEVEPAGHAAGRPA